MATSLILDAPLNLSDMCLHPQGSSGEILTASNGPTGPVNIHAGQGVAVAQVVCGDYFACLLLTDGSVKCFGSYQPALVCANHSIPQKPRLIPARLLKPWF